MQDVRRRIGTAGRISLILGISVCGIFLLTGCGGGGADGEAPGPITMDTATYEKWEISLVEMRINKNEEFSSTETSPLPAAAIPSFEGLNYYFPESALNFRTPFVAAAGTDTVSLVKRKGQTVKYIRRGHVSFKHDGRNHTLPVFGPADTTRGDYLWLPFTDATSGKETYPGGRYLDVKVDGEGMVDLDFNYAYNPLCDYNPERYNCTLPPAESRLDFAVEAGEKTFGIDH